MKDALNRKIGFDKDEEEYFWPYSIRPLENGPIMLCLINEKEVFIDEESISEKGWLGVDVMSANKIPSDIKQNFIDIIFTTVLKCEQ